MSNLGKGLTVKLRRQHGIVDTVVSVWWSTLALFVFLVIVAGIEV